jgi:ribose 5-phosphate isomerase A
MAVAPVTRALSALGASVDLRMGVNKDGPVITDQGNMVLDAKFEAIANPAEMEAHINNIPGVLENGLFVGVATEVLVGEVKDGQATVRSL